MKHIFIGLLLWYANNLCAQINAGALDFTFSNDGYDTQNFSSNEEITGLIQLSNSRILATGFTYLNDTMRGFIARYNSDGTLDATFGDSGFQIMDFGDFTLSPKDITITTSDKIVITGYVLESGINDGFIARFLPDGQPDNSFNEDGLLRVDVASVYELLNDIEIQPDGKLIAVGIADMEINTYTVVVRVTEDGLLDTTFANDGIYISTIADTYGNSLDLLADGKIIVGGRLYSGLDNKSMCFRLTADGILDLTFNDDGYFIVYFGDEDESCVKVIGLASGKIILCIYTVYEGAYHTKLLSVTDEGLIDNSFGYYGTASIDSIKCVDVAVDLNGDYIIAGNYSHFSTDNFRIAKISTAGIIDSTFGNDGLISTHFEASSWVNRIAIQNDGKFILGGLIGDFASDIAISRHLSEDAVGISDDQNNATISIFPNPVFNYCILSAPILFDKIYLFDLAGKLIATLPFTIAQDGLSFLYYLSIPEIISPNMYILSATNDKAIHSTVLFKE